MDTMKSVKYVIVVINLMADNKDIYYYM